MSSDTKAEYKNTIVTAIYHTSYNDRIGGRNYSFEHYENPFTNLLSLNANIIVFSHYPEINKIHTFFERNGFNNYKIVEYDLHKYIFSDIIYNLKEKHEIINDNGLIPGHLICENDRNTHLCLSKMDFLKMAIVGNYFDSNNYYWVDAGLFHHGLFPYSLGGCERYVTPSQDHFWPSNKNNICTPELITNLNEQNDNNKLLFIGLTQCAAPRWWNKLVHTNKEAHIIAGFFGGNKNEILTMHPLFQELTGQVLNSGELTLEEDILSIIIAQNKYDYLKFGTWYHDIASDPNFSELCHGFKSFYKIFLPPDNQTLKVKTSNVVPTNLSNNEHVETVYIFGDSHCSIFLNAESPEYKAVVSGYDGASISGLNETTSRLQYGPYMLNIVCSQPKTTYYLLKLGQVDMEFIIYHKIYIKKERFTLEEFCDLLINKYHRFIDHMLQITSNIIIASIHLPSYTYESVHIKDYIDRIIVNLHNDSVSDIVDKPICSELCDFSITQLTKNFMYFNELLRNLAKQLNLPFFDTTPSFIDNNTNLLKDEYRCYEHHYKGYTDDTTSTAKQVTRDCFCAFFKNMLKKEFQT